MYYYYFRCRGVVVSYSSDFQNGIDGNKKIKDVKRNIITDKDDDILKASTPCANIHDSKSAYAIVALFIVAFPWIRRIYVDRSYRGNFIEKTKHDLRIDIETTHSNYSGKFVPAKKRLVVENTFAWHENFRRLCRSYEVTTKSRYIIVKGLFVNSGLHIR